MRRHRDNCLRDIPELLVHRGSSGSTLDNEFSLYELKRAIIGAKETSPGKDDVCYEMVKHLSDTSLYILLWLFNRIWDKGILLTIWKHGIIISIAKPGKDPSLVSSYRPIALTSNLCKIMERMIIFRLNHVLGNKGYFSPSQWVSEKVGTLWMRSYV